MADTLADIMHSKLAAKYPTLGAASSIDDLLLQFSVDNPFYIRPYGSLSFYSAGPTESLSDAAYRWWTAYAGGTAPAPLSVAWNAAYWASDPLWTPPANNAVVTLWRGAGSSAVDATQGNPVWQPTYQASYANLASKPAIRFVPSNSVSAVITAIPQPVGVFIVGWCDPAHTGDGILGGGDNTVLAVMNQGLGGAMRLWAGNHMLPAGSGRDGPFAVAVNFTGATTSMRVNSTVYTGDPGSNGSGGTLVIGASPLSSSWSGAIAFVGIKTGVLTAQEITDMETWAKTFYGITMP